MKYGAAAAVFPSRQLRQNAVMPRKPRRARLTDVHEIAMALPGVECDEGPKGNPIYSIRKKSFIFFRNPRPDAFDPETGERYADVICFWVPSDEDKQALVQDESTPFFTTPHFNGYNAVLLRGSRIAEVDIEELREVITDAWLTRAPKRMGEQYLSEQR